MSIKKPEGEQSQAVSFTSPFIQESFDLNRMDAFVQGLGTTFTHWAASPSPIGLNDKGDYRRNDGVDVITSNGYLYTPMGTFTAILTNNTKNQGRPAEASVIDSAQGYLVLPRFYDAAKPKDDCLTPNPPDRIYLSPGDRLYHSDSQADDLVPWKELMNYSYNSDNVPMFPIMKVLVPIVDSRNISYKQGVDFVITPAGNIKWLETGNNPGIDPDTGSGRTFSCRYLYRAFYYVSSIVREVRISNVTKNGVRQSERMPQFVQLQREYLYHNINRGDETNPPPKKATEIRQTAELPDNIQSDQGLVKVEMTDIDNEN
jgi:hypothetical protein